MLRHLYPLSILLALCILAGCGSSGGGGGGGLLNQLDSLDDADGDGFPEIVPPEGVVFVPEESVAVSVINTVTRSQAAAAAGTEIPSSVGLTAAVAVDLTYPGGQTQRLSGSFAVGPFELALEVACPERIEVRVSVTAIVPVIGTQPVTSFGPYVFTQDGSEGYPYGCGSTVRVETYADDETGAMGVNIDVE